jgi:hypothetical protein
MQASRQWRRFGLDFVTRDITFATRELKSLGSINSISDLERRSLIGEPDVIDKVIDIARLIHRD